MSAELDVRALPPSIGSPRRRQAGLLAEAPDEAVDVQEEQVLQVGLLGSPVQAARLQPHVVQGRLGEERPSRGPGPRRAAGGGGGGSPELAVEHEPVERLLALQRPPRHERHPGGLIGRGEVLLVSVVVVVAVAVDDGLERRRRRPWPQLRRRELRVRRGQSRERVRARFRFRAEEVGGGCQQHHDPYRRRRGHARRSRHDPFLARTAQYPVPTTHSSVDGHPPH